jgi:hypothetical protein
LLNDQWCFIVKGAIVKWPVIFLQCSVVVGQPCMLMDRDEMSILYRGSSIDASYQVSVHLAEGFQRRRLKCEKLTDDR